MANKPLSPESRQELSDQLANLLQVAVTQLTDEHSSGVERMNAAAFMASMMVGTYADEITTADVADGLIETLEQALGIAAKRKQSIKDLEAAD